LPIRIRSQRYIDDYYYQILYPCVEQMRDSSDNRTKFDFVVACGLAELADEDGRRPPAQDQVLLEGTDHVWYTKTPKRWGEIPVSSQAELKSIALKK
jgi:hypothetical protein